LEENILKWESHRLSATAGQLEMKYPPKR
jgi:hypothetical protein